MMHQRNVPDFRQQKADGILSDILYITLTFRYILDYVNDACYVWKKIKKIIKNVFT